MKAWTNKKDAKIHFTLPQLHIIVNDMDDMEKMECVLIFIRQ